MADRFDFEQQIMAVWHTADDIDVVLKAYMDNPAPMTEDAVANALLGVKTLHQLRCEQLCNMFEELVQKGKIT
jgi:hypothetical protein